MLGHLCKKIFLVGVIRLRTEAASNYFVLVRLPHKCLIETAIGKNKGGENKIATIRLVIG